MAIKDEDVSSLAKELMTKRGIGVRELGRAMGKSHSRLSDRLNGKYSWKFEELFTLASALGVSATWFTEELEKRESAQRL